MKRLRWLACLLLVGCAAVRTSVKVTDPAVIRARPQPVKIFGIGYYGSDCMVLTLTDAGGQYLTVIIPRDDRLKKGDTYTP